MARHGGGAFSGKDCTKVDRSAAYAARYAAKNVVAAGLAKKCEIQLSYAIGVAQPTSIAVDTFGTGKLSDTKLVEILRENFDFRPAGIIKMLDLRRPIYKQPIGFILGTYTKIFVCSAEMILDIVKLTHYCLKYFPLCLTPISSFSCFSIFLTNSINVKLSKFCQPVIPSGHTFL